MRKTALTARMMVLALFLCFCAAGCGVGTSGNGGATEQPDSAVLPGHSEAVEDGLLRLAMPDAVSTMDVHKTSEEYTIPLNIYERLLEVTVNEDGSTELTKGLAEDWSLSADGLTYSFTLRPDAYFSDGTPVKASDVAFSFTRMLSLPESEQQDFANMILGADAVLNGEADTLEGIRVMDDRHLQITLSEPLAAYLSVLATPSCSVLSEKNVTEAGAAFGTSAEQTVGSGPYMVTEFTNDKVTLEKNPYYHSREGEELSAERVEIYIMDPALIDRSFQAGELDILDAAYVNPDVVENVYKTGTWKDRLISQGSVEIRYLMLNVAEAPLDDVRIRQAVQMAIDRQKLLDELYGGDGELVDGIYPRGLIGFSEENQGWLQYDPEQAARLVKEAAGAKAVSLEIAVSSETNVRELKMLEMIRQDLSEAGFNAAVVSYDDATRLALRKAGELMVSSGEWGADFNDPDNFIYTYFGNREKTRYYSSNFSDKEILNRIAQARTIQDKAQRLAEYAELEKRLVQDEAVWVPLFSTDHLFVLGERVERFAPFWAGWSDVYFKDVVLKR